MALKNLLCSDFNVKKKDSEGLTEFFSNLEELDKHIQFIPLSKIEVMSPAMGADNCDFFDIDEYCFSYIKRATDKTVIRKVSIDSLLKEREDTVSDFIEELLAMKDSMFISDGTGMFFVTDESFRDFAKLAKLGGEALKTPSAYRDNYIASLLIDRCNCYAKKRTPKPAFTAVAFEQCGIKRVMAARSGNYIAIPQSILKKVFLSMMDRDDWGAVECHDWYIDHDISYVDLEFPDVADNILVSYPDMPKLPIVPGVRLSTGSTGLNSLKATMTWRYEGNSYPALLDGVTQKHCNTYEGAAFIERVHETVWDRYGELPEKLAELYTVPVSSNASIISGIAGKVIKELALHKIFMQNTEAPKTEKADHCQRIIDYISAGLCYKPNVTAYDIATRFMTVADNVDMPDSYRAPIRNALMKAPYCHVFSEITH